MVETVGARCFSSIVFSFLFLFRVYTTSTYLLHYRVDVFSIFVYFASIDFSLTTA